MTGIRVGVDVLRATELDRLLADPRFCARTYAAAELALVDGAAPSRRREFLAGRFAAKEAILKVLGRGLLQGVALRDIVVDRSARGGPVVRLTGTAAAAAAEERLEVFSVSIAHKPSVVVAAAVGHPALPAEPLDATQVAERLAALI